jgi:hypothetical protein
MPRQFSFDSHVDRKRFGQHDLDLDDPSTSDQYNEGTAALRKILAKNNVPSAKAERAIQEVVQAAVEQRYALPRLLRVQSKRKSAAQNRVTLIMRLEELLRTIQNVSPASADMLGQAMAAHSSLMYFDTETFASLLNSFREILSHGTSEEQQQGDRCQDIALAWEGAPATTRNAVEAALRRSAIPTDPSDFLKKTVELLREFAPPRSLKVAPTWQSSLRMAQIFQSVGLKIGTSYDWKNGKDHEGPFQRFCAAAFRAAGVHVRISRRQTKRLQSKPRTKPIAAITGQHAPALPAPTVSA